MASAWIVAYDQDSGLIAVVPEPSAVDIITIKYLTPNEHKVFWQLAKSDFSSVLVKIDDKERITYILGSLRSGKEVPFDKIGELEKAPLLTDKVVGWDVVRPDKSLLRVVARGAERKASSITVFIVKRPPPDSR
jgi:hypothetical protein